MKKKIGLQTFGSEGDIRPFLLLAKGLREASHEVTLNITPLDSKDYTKYAEEFDITINHVGDFSQEKLDRLFANLKEVSIMEQGVLIMEYFFDSHIDLLFEASLALCTSNDIVVGHFGHFPLSLAAKSTQTPRVSFITTAMAIPSDHYAPIGLPNWGKIPNRILWGLLSRLANMFYKKKVNSYVHKVDLAPIKDYSSEIAFSPLLNVISVSDKVLNCEVKKPYPNTHYSGRYRPIDSFDTLPDGLHEFLQKDGPVGYITFGSLTTIDMHPDETITLLLETIKKTNIRAIVQFEWDRVQTIPEDENLFCVENAPHDQVFPHCDFVVHHGGAGTTQTSISSGVPSVVVIHGGDQGFNGWMLHNAGVAPKALKRTKLTPEKLTNAIQEVLHEKKYHNRAQELALEVRDENGVVRTIELIESCLSNLKPKFSC